MDSEMTGIPPPRLVVRIPLSPGQHILHLILTLCTGGLWGVVWIVRAIQGNKVWADTQPGYYGPRTVLYPGPGWQPPQGPFPNYGIERNADGDLTWVERP